MTRVLILGGTSEARALAASLGKRRSLMVISSLAGRVDDPVLPDGEVRVGGFGGEAGLTDWLTANGIDLLVDATHPFAATITASADAACRKLGIPMLVLWRKPWQARPEDDWTAVASLDDAASLLPTRGTRVFLTVGRQGLPAFAGLDDLWFLARTIDPPSGPTPANMVLLMARGPFDVSHESNLMREHGIDILVTKNSGGKLTSAKLAAARELGIPVIMVRRPALPGGLTAADSVDRAAKWVLSSRRS